MNIIIKDGKIENLEELMQKSHSGKWSNFTNGDKVLFEIRTASGKYQEHLYAINHYRLDGKNRVTAFTFDPYPIDGFVDEVIIDYTF